VTANPTPRDHNKAAVLDVVLSRSPVTRNELIELTGLSKATVSRAVEELRTDGFVIDGGRDEVVGRGRRSTHLDLPATTGHVVGVSFGAQTTGVVVADLRGREVRQAVVPTARHDATRKAARWLVDLVAETSEPAGGPLRQMVVAVPARVLAGTEVVDPAETMDSFAGQGLYRALGDLVDAPLTLESDAHASLLGILAEDATLGDAALFSLSSTLSFATCKDHELVRGRTPTFGDIGVLFSGAGDESLAGLLSTTGLLRFGRGRGLDLERVEDLWEQPHDDVSRAGVVDAFTTAVVTAVSAIAVTLDPKSVFVVGRLQPLVDEVLPEVRRRLDKSLPTPPVVETPSQVLGLSVAQGAVHACLGLARDRLRTAVLEARQSPLAARSAPAF
jgi:predicted NBD/HSP70 family sugar kinase